MRGNGGKMSRNKDRGGRKVGGESLDSGRSKGGGERERERERTGERERE